MITCTVCRSATSQLCSFYAVLETYASLRPPNKQSRKASLNSQKMKIYLPPWRVQTDRKSFPSLQFAVWAHLRTWEVYIAGLRRVAVWVTASSQCCTLWLLKPTDWFWTLDLRMATRFSWQVPCLWCSCVLSRLWEIQLNHEGLEVCVCVYMCVCVCVCEFAIR